MKHIPFFLTVFRAVLGPFLLLLTYTDLPRGYYFPLLLAGMLSDYFDGVLARRWYVVTPWLRRFDSMTDVVYYAFVFIVACRFSAPLFLLYLPWIISLLLSEVLCIAIALTRFGKLPATHTYLAKTYGLSLFISLAAIIAFSVTAAWPVLAFCGIGLLANIEVIAIQLASTEGQPVDVSSLFCLKK